MGKSIFQSKTFIVAAISGALALINQFAPFIPAEYANYVAMAVSALTILARYLTDNQPIKPVI